MSACKSTSWRELGPASRKAACSFSLRPSHKQHPGLEYRISLREGTEEEDEENEAEGVKIRRALCARRSNVEEGREIVAAVVDIILTGSSCPAIGIGFFQLGIQRLRRKMISKI